MAIQIIPNGTLKFAWNFLKTDGYGPQRTHMDISTHIYRRHSGICQLTCRIAESSSSCI